MYRICSRTHTHNQKFYGATAHNVSTADDTAGAYAYNIFSQNGLRFNAIIRRKYTLHSL